MRSMYTEGTRETFCPMKILLWLILQKHVTVIGGFPMQQSNTIAPAMSILQPLTMKAFLPKYRMIFLSGMNNATGALIL